MLFLIDYDRRRGQIVRMFTYDDSRRREAEDARLALDLELRQSGVEREIVLLEAASEEALRKTHSRYFENWMTIARSA